MPASRCPPVRWWIGHTTHDSRAHDGRGAARWRSCAAVEPSGRLGDKPTAPEFVKLRVSLLATASIVLFDDRATRVPDLVDDDDPLIRPTHPRRCKLPRRPGGASMPEASVIIPLYGSHRGRSVLPTVARAWLMQDVSCEVIVATPGRHSVDMMLDDVGAEPNVRVLAGDVAVTAPGAVAQPGGRACHRAEAVPLRRGHRPARHRLPAARDRAGGRRCRLPAVDAPAGPGRRPDRPTSVPESPSRSMLLERQLFMDNQTRAHADACLRRTRNGAAAGQIRVRGRSSGCRRRPS